MCASMYGRIPSMCNNQSDPSLPALWVFPPEESSSPLPSVFDRSYGRFIPSEFLPVLFPPCSPPSLFSAPLLLDLPPLILDPPLSTSKNNRNVFFFKKLPEWRKKNKLLKKFKWLVCYLGYSHSSSGEKAVAFVWHLRGLKAKREWDRCLVELYH